MKKNRLLLIISGIFILLLFFVVTIFYFSSKKSAVKEVTDEKIISDRVLQFYKSYIMNAASLESVYKEGYITLENFNALKQTQGYDPVLCTQGGSESPILVDKVTIGSSNATVLVKQYYGGIKPYNFMQLIIRLSDQKITSIKCQP